ncbi:hypothetical protein E3Q22_03680 [Wallemia mellicola]|uniref:Velvet domain-containing protein n=1 Tax=Wallemia mellicola TaxID=1708541 RepID=A0A4T0M0U9_9BASI|nr:hypothetical protein E3Q22_03680 [Wallemia mellicola]TIC40472.1 hypothetical protein E3Q08_03752 [Wallemia mellicola]
MSKRPIDNQFERNSRLKLSVFRFSGNLLRDSSAQLPLYSINIRQHAKNARVCSFREKVDRRPIDPPPIIQIHTNEYDKSEFHQSTAFFMTATLIRPYGDDLNEVYSQKNVRATAGITVQTPTKLKDENGTDGSFCIWNHISVRQEGEFRLYFRLFERRDLDIVQVASTISDIFAVHSPKNFPGMSESSYLTKCLASQGVRIRVRKENKALNNKINDIDTDNMSSSYVSRSSSNTTTNSNTVFNYVQHQHSYLHPQDIHLPRLLPPIQSPHSTTISPSPLHQSYIPFSNSSSYTIPHSGVRRISQPPRPLPPEKKNDELSNRLSDSLIDRLSDRLSSRTLPDPISSLGHINQQHQQQEQRQKQEQEQQQQQQSKGNIFQLLDAARTLNEDETDLNVN